MISKIPGKCHPSAERWLRAASARESDSTNWLSCLRADGSLAGMNANKQCSSDDFARAQGKEVGWIHG